MIILRIVGILLVLIGLLVSFTIIALPAGLLMMLVGGVLVIAGRPRKIYVDVRHRR